MAKASIDGSIVEREKGVWDIYVSLGCDPLTGKYKRATKRVRGTKRDANNALKELISKRDSGVNLAARQVTLSEIAALWLDAKRAAGTCGETHLKTLGTLLRHVERYLGATPIDKITPVAIDRTYAAIRKERELSGTTMKKIHDALKSVFEKAIDYEIITRNPCRNVTPPKNSQVNRRSLNEVEAAKLRKGIESLYREELERFADKELRQTEKGNTADRGFLYGAFTMSCIIALRVIMATGLRRGEAVALRWCDIDFNNGTVSVRQSITKDGDIKAPKSSAGYRTISIDRKSLESLSEWKITQATYLQKLDMAQGGKTPVACSNLGGYICPDNMERWWIATRKELGFPTLRLHELRHTQATLLLAHGVDLKTVQHRLGHASAALTLGTYAHAVPANDEGAANVIGGLLDGEERQCKTA